MVSILTQSSVGRGNVWGVRFRKSQCQINFIDVSIYLYSVFDVPQDSTDLSDGLSVNVNKTDGMATVAGAGEKNNSERGKLNPERCHLYLERKRRYCRTVPPTGSLYCVDHSQNVTVRPGFTLLLID